MNIRWLWLDYVPEGISLTKDQRRLVQKRTWVTVQRHIVLLTCAVFVGMCAVIWLRSRFPPSNYRGEMYLLSALVSLVCYSAIGWVYARPAVFRAIREAGVNVCPKCGYDLRGQSGDGCSECGWDAGDEGAS